MKCTSFLTLTVLYTIVNPLNCAYKIRDYDPLADNTAVLNLCNLNEPNRSEMCFDLAVLLHKMKSQTKEATESGRHIGQVLEDNGTVIAFALYEAPIEHKLNTIKESQELKLAKLSFIIVDSKYEGKGYGLLSLYNLKKELQNKGFTDLLIAVKKDDPILLDWYKKQSFVPVNSNESQSLLEETLRMSNERHGYTLLKLPLAQEATKTGVTLSDKHKVTIDLIMEFEEGKKTQKTLVRDAIKQAIKAFIATSPSPLIQPVQLCKIITYFYNPNVTRDDAYNFAALLLNRTSINNQTKKYIAKAIDFTELKYPVLEEIKTGVIREYPKESFLITRTVF